MTDELGGRYFREARFFLAGDKVAAQSHILEARSLMGYMRDQLALGGPAIQVQYATLQDGTQIKATMMNGQYQAEIVSPATSTSTTTEKCPAFWSGLFIPAIEGSFTRIVGDHTIQYIGSGWLQPSDYQMNVTPSLLAQHPDRGDRLAVEEFSNLEIMSTTEGLPPLTYFKVFASAYSGEMRKAVQLFLGMGVELLLPSETGFYDPVFDYGFAGTIGLVRVPSEVVGLAEAPPPEFWMIRMPKYDSYGILAMKYPVCYGVTEDQIAAGLEYIPSPGVTFPASSSEIADLIASGDMLELMTRSAFDAIVSGMQPMYPDCGWAFSYSGHECQTVLLGGDSDVARTYRVKFYFSATSEFITASGEIVESAALKTTLQQAPRFPYIVPGLMSLVPLDQAFSSSSGDISAPVHAYYIGDDEQVWRVFNDPTYVEPQVVDTRQYPSTAGPRCPIEEQVTITGADASFSGYTLNGAMAHTQAFTGYISGTYYTYTFTGSPAATPKYAVLSGSVGTYDTIEVGDDSWTEVRADMSEYKVSRVTFSVPFHQREGVFILDSGTSNSDTHTYSLMHTGKVAKDQFWTKLVDDLYVRDYSHAPRQSSLYDCSSSIVSWPGTGIATGVNSIPGAGYPYTSPIIPPVTEFVPRTVTQFGNLNYFGAVNIPGRSLDENEVARCLSIPSGGMSQLLFAWTDAFNPGVAVLSSVVDDVGAKFNNTSKYDISEGTIYYGFIGLALKETSWQ